LAVTIFDQFMVKMDSSDWWLSYCSYHHTGGLALWLCVRMAKCGAMIYYIRGLARLIGGRHL
jgi:hypothetical protein